ncbi:SGNH/GDSL hydrolase family protein [Luteolibacter sp. SL250]|uniref:SGNH/GDSL hydrolase family protein n=1 Tax=Luteolibacter sp. SL250 TaxID=2995170 RepID=UPI00226F92D2|nr:SGNH/GDSL hydrolase family protein [Luteolibacter sp. SL250]WAC19509.1 SGNH/GDSL hydrolase family protein [Luteolibacter sp. SL250]
MCQFISILFAFALSVGSQARAGLSQLLGKAERGEPISVVFFGGSLTFGANASDPGTTSYRGLMMEWLRSRHSSTPFTFHDASVGGTGSQLGMFRLERDVLRHNPDLVFLDFTVNDDAEGTDVQTLASYERIVRTLVEKEVTVVPVLMLFRWHAEKPDIISPRHADHRRLAEAYGLPVADVCGAIQKMAKAGMNPAEIWNLGDGAHPGDEGYRLFFGIVRDTFEAAIKDRRPQSAPPSTIFDDLYPKHNRGLLAGHLPSGWRMKKTWRTALWYDGLSSRWMGDVATASAKEKSGALEIGFEGSMVGFFGERNGLTPPVRIWIDGQPVLPPQAKDGDTLWRLDTSRFAPPKKGSGNLFVWQPIARDLPDGKHTLRIEPVWDGADPDAELRIESICSAGR